MPIPPKPETPEPETPSELRAQITELLKELRAADPETATKAELQEYQARLQALETAAKTMPELETRLQKIETMLAELDAEAAEAREAEALASSTGESAENVTPLSVGKGPVPRKPPEPAKPPKAPRAFWKSLLFGAE